MDTKYFNIHHLIDTDHLFLKRIGAADNESDAMTKNVGKTLFYRHMDYLMSKLIPDYARNHKDLQLYDQAFSVGMHKAEKGLV